MKYKLNSKQLLLCRMVGNYQWINMLHFYFKNAAWSFDEYCFLYLRKV
jgi:hypothetical protein